MGSQRQLGLLCGKSHIYILKFTYIYAPNSYEKLVNGELCRHTNCTDLFVSNYWVNALNNHKEECAKSLVSFDSMVY